MALVVNRMVQYFLTDEEKQNAIIECVDKLILQLPDFNYFHLHQEIRKIESDNEKKKKIVSITSEIRVFLERLGYIEHPPGGNAVFILTEKGRSAKAKGGYFKYLKSLEPKRDWLKIIPIILSIIFGLSTFVFAYLNYQKNNSKFQLELLKNKNDSLQKRIKILERK